MAKDNTSKSEHPLIGKGLLFKSDPRDQNFKMYEAPPTIDNTMRQSWELGQVLDQGQTSMCCGYAWAQFLQTDPWDDSIATDDSPQNIYHQAQLIDGLGGVEPSHYGTTIRAAAQVLQTKKVINSYVWANTVEDMAKFIVENGPVVCGTDWFTGMSNPDPSGFVHPTSSYEGGHAWLIHGVDVQWETFFAVNSWGTSWGKNGRFFIRFADFTTLLTNGAQVCSAIKAHA